jgi:hypothetical protein
MRQMRRLFVLAAVGGLVWWFIGGRRGAARRGVTIGYADGSSLTLEAGSPELERLLQIADETTVT